MIVLALLLAGMPAAPQANPTTPAVVADPAKAPAVAPEIPLTKGPAPAGQVAPKDDLAALSDGDAPNAIQAGTWKTIDENRRRLLIMGSTDGFAAAGASAPCFPGRSVDKLEQELMTAGFGDSQAERLPEALTKIAAPQSACVDTPERGYDTGFLMKLPNESLAVYLTGTIRAYARVKPCPAEAQSYAATLAVTAISLADADTDPVQALRIALVEGCTGPAAR